jgi:hypothetical protein
MLKYYFQTICFFHTLASDSNLIYKTPPRFVGHSRHCGVDAGKTDVPKIKINIMQVQFAIRHHPVKKLY